MGSTHRKEGMILFQKGDLLFDGAQHVQKPSQDGSFYFLGK
jgi:hypothetical protein